MNWIEAWNELEKFLAQQRELAAGPGSIGALSKIGLIDMTLLKMSDLFKQIEFGGEI